LPPLILLFSPAEMIIFIFIEVTSREISVIRVTGHYYISHQRD
jgi:hypothetical protein